MDIMKRIKPVPQMAVQGPGKVVLGKLGAADFKIEAENLDGELAQRAVEYMYNSLSKVVDACAKGADGAVSIQIQLSREVPTEVTRYEDQAYAIEARDQKITLTGYGEAGLYFAVTTLMQCVAVDNNEVFVPEMNVLDWPDLRTRGHFMECRYGSNLMNLDDWKAVVDDMAAMKMNQLVVALYGCWNVQYDGIISEYVYIPVKKYPEIKSNVVKHYFSPREQEWVNEVVDVPMAKEDFFGDLIAYGKTRGVEIVPLWNSYGHNTIIPRTHPEVSAVKDGKPSGHGFCVSNPATYELLYHIFDQIIDDYLIPNGITSFHIGMDEVRDERATDVNDLFKVYSPWCDCDECAKLSNEEKFINHAVKLISYLKGRGMKNVYIYSDMMRNAINPENFKKLLVEKELMDVTVVDWWTYANVKEKLNVTTMYPHLGFRSTIKPMNGYYHWNIASDSIPNIYRLHEMAHREGCCEGLMSYSAWDKSFDRNNVCLADYSWNFVGTGNQKEYKDRYAAREFPTYEKEARKALENFDKVTEEVNSTPINEKDVLSNKTILQNHLAYYFYSYVREGLPYPRNFPGEAMERILADRELYELHFEEILKLSKESKVIFQKIAKDVKCNVKMAERYVYEFNNFICLAEDYKALLEIHDLLAKEERGENVSALVAEIAKRRKQARIENMLLLEQVKEEYLMASHMRNQSIFMQMFADIEAYAGSTAPEELNLNLLDMREIGSKTFYGLR